MLYNIRIEQISVIRSKSVCNHGVHGQVLRKISTHSNASVCSRSGKVDSLELLVIARSDSPVTYRNQILLIPLIGTVASCSLRPIICPGEHILSVHDHELD
jgi:hypothetical protein